jgi:HAD superfamily hydrolase (TIGR01549 family)
MPHDSVRTILFDWDGTLFDSFSAGYHASVTVLQHLGVEVTRERFLETYSPNWHESYAKLGVPKERWTEADRLWRKTYDASTSKPFPHAFETLSRLHDASFSLGLVTSGDRDRVENELARFELRDYFSVVVCFEDTEKKKPDPAPLALALGKLAVEASITAYVGDRPEDIEMGRSVGSYTIAVESEYGPRGLLEEAAPDWLLPHAGHLPDRLGV